MWRLAEVFGFASDPTLPPGPPIFENSTGFRAHGGWGWWHRRASQRTPPPFAFPNFGPAHAEETIGVYAADSGHHARPAPAGRIGNPAGPLPLFDRACSACVRLANHRGLGRRCRPSCKAGPFAGRKPSVFFYWLTILGLAGKARKDPSHLVRVACPESPPLGIGRGHPSRCPPAQHLQAPGSRGGLGLV